MSGKDFKLNTFGIGDCDRDLVEGLATRGKGKSYYVEFSKLDNLKSQVVDALEISQEPILHKAVFQFGNQNEVD